MCIRDSTVAVLRPPLQHLEDEQVKRALDEIETLEHLLYYSR